MNAVVVYKSKYGATKAYAEWIAEELSCDIAENKNLKAESLLKYDTIIYGGGLYAEVIAGVSLITKNIDKFENKNLIVFSTGITPLDCREYYDKLVIKKNFGENCISKIKIFNFSGKMIFSELSAPHKAAIKMLKKIMQSKENPAEMEKLLIKLCDTNGDYTDKNDIGSLVNYVRGLQSAGVSK